MDYVTVRAQTAGSRTRRVADFTKKSEIRDNAGHVALCDRPSRAVLENAMMSQDVLAGRMEATPWQDFLLLCPLRSAGEDKHTRAGIPPSVSSECQLNGIISSG